MTSILSNERRCAVCGWTLNLEKHHIFFGRANRPISEQYGCWIYLCHMHHTGSLQSVHHSREMDLHWKKKAQLEWEKQFGSREDFIKTFGRSYL